MLDGITLNRPEPEIIESTLASNAKPWKAALRATEDVTNYATRTAIAETRMEYQRDFPAVCTAIGAVSRENPELAREFAVGFVSDLRNQRQVEYTNIKLDAEIEMYRIKSRTNVAVLFISLVMGTLGAMGAITCAAMLLSS